MAALGHIIPYSQLDPSSVGFADTFSPKREKDVTSNLSSI
jgi:hypothetical protein